MEAICYSPIGVISSPFKRIEGMPIQNVGAEGISGQIELDRGFEGGLKDLEQFSHIILLYHFHLGSGFSLTVKPFLEDEVHGVFATRAPKRPNPIGFSIVRLISIDGNILHIEDVDVVDGTPLLDIKPYVPDFDSRSAEKIGWFSGKASDAAKVRSDTRFK